jgi:hypothetical protein
VEVEERRVERLDEFPVEEVDLLINCTGIGAANLGK